MIIKPEILERLEEYAQRYRAGDVNQALSELLDLGDRYWYDTSTQMIREDNAGSARKPTWDGWEIPEP